MKFDQIEQCGFGEFDDCIDGYVFQCVEVVWLCGGVCIDVVVELEQCVLFGWIEKEDFYVVLMYGVVV